jgi:hypothetical protein
MPKVLNARQAGTKPAADRVYVGRPSRSGNPFVIGRDGTRDEVIAKYRAWDRYCRDRYFSIYQIP